MSLAELTGVLGLIFGVVGTVLGVLNHLRDRANLKVTVKWDMSVSPGSGYDPNKQWGVVTVVNTGRRPIYASHTALRLPKGHRYSHLLLPSSIAGKKLSEGDPPELFIVSQEGMEQYADIWRKIVVQVSDSTGATWISDRLPKNAIPSWAKAKQGKEI